MSKILSALLVGFFAVSLNAFAETPAATDAAAPAAKAEVKHTAAPAKKTKHKKAADKATSATPAIPASEAK